MKIALDPYMHRHLPLVELPRLPAELGYEYLELSPRSDFLDWPPPTSTSRPRRSPRPSTST
jgi:sugar phosphate isomerase/epimerase